MCQVLLNIQSFNGTFHEENNKISTFFKRIKMCNDITVHEDIFVFTRRTTQKVMNTMFSWKFFYDFLFRASSGDDWSPFSICARRQSELFRALQEVTVCRQQTCLLGARDIRVVMREHVCLRVYSVFTSAALSPRARSYCNAPKSDFCGRLTRNSYIKELADVIIQSVTLSRCSGVSMTILAPHLHLVSRVSGGILDAEKSQV